MGSDCRMLRLEYAAHGEHTCIANKRYLNAIMYDANRARNRSKPTYERKPTRNKHLQQQKYKSVESDEASISEGEEVALNGDELHEL